MTEIPTVLSPREEKICDFCKKTYGNEKNTVDFITVVNYCLYIVRVTLAILCFLSAKHESLKITENCRIKSYIVEMIITIIV